MRDMEHQRQIIDTFVNSVYVFDDRVVLNFNFTDDSKTISREEVLGSSAVENAPPKQEPLTLVRGFFVASSTNPRQSRTVQNSNRAAAHSAVSKATVRLCLARGSQRLGMSTKKDAARPFGLGMWWAVQNSNSNKQRQGITVAVCPAFCFASPYIVRFGSIAAYVRTWSVRTYAGKRASSDI